MKSFRESVIHEVRIGYGAPQPHGLDLKWLQSPFGFLEGHAEEIAETGVERLMVTRPAYGHMDGKIVVDHAEALPMAHRNALRQFLLNVPCREKILFTGTHNASRERIGAREFALIAKIWGDIGFNTFGLDNTGGLELPVIANFIHTLSPSRVYVEAFSKDDAAWRSPHVHQMALDSFVYDKWRYPKGPPRVLGGSGDKAVILRDVLGHEGERAKRLDELLNLGYSVIPRAKLWKQLVADRLRISC